jgi:hypothetical protein
MYGLERAFPSWLTVYCFLCCAKSFSLTQSHLCISFSFVAFWGHKKGKRVEAFLLLGCSFFIVVKI